MAAQAPLSFFGSSQARATRSFLRRFVDAIMDNRSRMRAHVQDDDGFAVIWRNAQRARSELLGVWFSRLVSRLWKLSHVGWFKFGVPRCRSAEREESTQAD
jgi:hypothetical protein